MVQQINNNSLPYPALFVYATLKYYWKVIWINPKRLATVYFAKFYANVVKNLKWI
jgi:hypothetical protein